MAVNTLDYGAYRSENSAINNCIQNIEMELNIANSKLNEAVQDASGTWASTDIEDWNIIYNDINAKFNRMQELMNVVSVSAEEMSATENAYAGFNAD